MPIGGVKVLIFSHLFTRPLLTHISKQADFNSGPSMHPDSQMVWREEHQFGGARHAGQGRWEAFPERQQVAVRLFYQCGNEQHRV